MNHYVYIDAENHFIRAGNAARRVLDTQQAPQILAETEPPSRVSRPIPANARTSRYLWNPDYLLFWDCGLVRDSMGYPGEKADIRRVLYVAPCTGSDEVVFQMQSELRKYGFDPLVVREERNQKKQRAKRLSDRENPVLDKAKGCDIAIATNMVADAASDLFDVCHLFTSDADFLPAIEAVRRLGKVVRVYGVQNDLPTRSPYLFVPDRFVDIEVYIRGFIQPSMHRRLEEAKRRLEDRQQRG